MDDMKTTGREKYWSELTADEKIERQRRVIKANAVEIRRLSDNVRDLLRHRHLDNEIVVELRSFRNDVACGQPIMANNDDIYF